MTTTSIGAIVPTDDRCRTLILDLCNECEDYDDGGLLVTEEDYIQAFASNHSNDLDTIWDAAHGDVGALIRLRGLVGLDILT